MKADQIFVLISIGGKAITESSDAGPIFKFFTPSTTEATPQEQDEELDIPFRECIIGWMEINRNRWSVYGYPDKTPVGLVISKEQGWTNAAVYVNERTKLTLVGENVRKRMGRYKQLYFTTAAAAKKTGAGVSEDGGAENYDEEQAAKCPFFFRMDKLFGTSPHKEPHGEMSTGVGGGVLFSSRKKNYVVSSSSAKNGKDGGAAMVILNFNQHSEAVGVQRVQKNGVNQQHGDSQEHGEGLDYEEYGEDLDLEEGREIESEEEAEYNEAREEQVQKSQQTLPFQGDAFTEIRPSRPLLSESDVTMKSNSSAKRLLSGDRSTVSKGGSRRVIENPRQQSIANLHNHSPPGKPDGLMSPEILMNAKAEGNIVSARSFFSLLCFLCRISF